MVHLPIATFKIDDRPGHFVLFFLGQRSAHPAISPRPFSSPMTTLNRKYWPWFTSIAGSCSEGIGDVLLRQRPSQRAGEHLWRGSGFDRWVVADLDGNAGCSCGQHLLVR
jgi:hypothetical protein